jgi:hypothetical protein
VWVVNEYAHVKVTEAIEPNRAFRAVPGLVQVRDGPFGEQLDTFGSQAFAVCDHQIAHIYVNGPLRPEHFATFKRVHGVSRVLIGPEREEIGLNHARAGDVVMLAEPQTWFAYRYWLDGRAPDYARTVDIHRKPGYDPCELFFDPQLRWPKLRVLRRVMAKKLGLRALVDVIPLDASLVRGSHGLVVSDLLDKPVMVADGPPPAETIVHQCAVRDMALRALEAGG